MGLSSIHKFDGRIDLFITSLTNLHCLNDKPDSWNNIVAYSWIPIASIGHGREGKDPFWPNTGGLYSKG